MASKKNTTKAETLEEHMQVLAAELEKAAESYGLCDDFYTVMAKINEKLTVEVPVAKLVKGYGVTIFCPQVVRPGTKRPTKAELQVLRDALMRTATEHGYIVDTSDDEFEVYETGTIEVVDRSSRVQDA